MLQKITINYFRQALNSVMTDNKFDREIHGFRSGKLNGTKLYKSQINNFDKVFKRRVERKNKHYKVHFIIDVSGSMTSYYDEDDHPDQVFSWEERECTYVYDYCPLGKVIDFVLPINEAVKKHKIDTDFICFGNGAMHCESTTPEDLKKEFCYAGDIYGASTRMYEPLELLSEELDYDLEPEQNLVRTTKKTN